MTLMVRIVRCAAVVRIYCTNYGSCNIVLIISNQGSSSLLPTYNRLHFFLLFMWVLLCKRERERERERDISCF